MTPTFVTIIVDEHDELPEGCCMRFKAIDTPRVVRLVRMDAEIGSYQEDHDPGRETGCGG